MEIKCIDQINTKYTTCQGWQAQCPSHPSSETKVCGDGELDGIMFKRQFPIFRLQHATETETMRMLQVDNEQRENVGLQLNTYQMDLIKYGFDTE